MADLSLADRVSQLRPTAVNRVLQQVRQLETEGRSFISLMRGQPDTPTPAHIVEAAVRSLRDGRTGYADNRGEPALRRTVAEKLQREQGLSYDPDREILITDGATLGLYAALGALVQPGRLVLLPDPVYDAYASPIAIWGGRPKSVPATIRDGRFTIERNALENSWVANRDILLLNTPWNPVGTVLTRAELEEIMGFAEANEAPVSSDEIYESLVYDGRHHVSPAAVSADARARTVVINSLSKTYAMTGWRVGYCAGPESVIKAMFLVLQQSSRGPALFVQDAAACAALVRPGLRPPNGGGVPGPARPGGRTAARDSGRRAARPRGRPLRDGGHPRIGEALRGRRRVPDARCRGRRGARRGLRLGR